jgi:hypothetical protein
MTDEPSKEPSGEEVVVPEGGEKPSNDQITDKLFEALQGDESLTDDDRRSIAEGLATKAGGKVPVTVKPTTDHWTERKLW